MAKLRIHMQRDEETRDAWIMLGDERIGFTESRRDADFIVTWLKKNWANIRRAIDVHEQQRWKR